MEGKSINGHVFKKNKQITTLSSKSNVKIKDEEIFVNPQLLFQRLVTAANGMFPDVSDVFKYELSNVPSALFEPSGLMRQAQKSALADALWNIGDCSLSESLGNDVYHVIDGGSLLQRIPWKKGETFEQIFQSYIDYVNNRYAKPIVVFDGYVSGPSTKDHTHERRTKGIAGTRICFKESTPFKSKKDIFLANSENKQNFINMLSEKMENNGFITEHAGADADVLIVKTAVRYSQSFSTVVVGEDTDLLVLLLYHGAINSKLLVFQSDQASRISKSKVWDIQKTKHLLGNQTCNLLPFLHAMTGCDTTSRLYGIGKGMALKRLFSDLIFIELASVFLNTQTSSEDIIKKGQQAMLRLYGGVAGENLDSLRYRKFTAKVVSNSLLFVQVQTLPPTSDAAAEHCKRVFYQIQEWTNDSMENYDPTEWGWILNDGILQPTKTVPPAPDKLLNIIRCKCKTSCDTRRCTCRKHGLECTFACSKCKGQNCSNCQRNGLDGEQNDSFQI